MHGFVKCGFVELGFVKGMKGQIYVKLSLFSSGE